MSNPPAAGMPALTVADVTAGEADGVLRFTVSLSAAATEPVTVSYATVDGTPPPARITSPLAAR